MNALYARIAVEMSVRQRVGLLSPAVANEQGGESVWEQTFHYHIPPALRNHLQVGHVVRVPFGNQRALGIVAALDDEAPDVQIKDVEALIGARPALRPRQIAVGRWMSTHYACPLFNCLALFAPLAAFKRSTPQLVTSDMPADPPLEADDKAMWQTVHRGDGMSLAEAEARFGAKRVKQALQAGWVGRCDRWPTWGASVATIQVATLTLMDPTELDPRSVGRDTKAAQALAWLADQSDQQAALDAFVAANELSASIVRDLEQQGYIAVLPEQALLWIADDAAATTSRQREIVTYLTEHAQPVQEHTLLTALGATSRLIETLLDKGAIKRESQRPALVKLALNHAALRTTLLELRRATRHLELAEALCQAGGQMPLSELRQVAAYSAATWRDLLEAGAVRLEKETIDQSHARYEHVLTEAPCFTSAQDEVWRQVATGLQDEIAEVFLLHGVTGSGKTEIYLRAAQEVVRRGQQVIALVPEIALTPQTIERFAARFERLGVIHSRLSAAQRYDEWLRIWRGEVDVVIGPRSALFAPMAKPGLIILDEEHETSYKQEAIPGVQLPCYHARDVAAQMSEAYGHTVILGSATPDVGSYYRAEQRRYTLLQMPQRVMGHRAQWEAQQRDWRIPQARYRGKPIEQANQDACYMDLPPVYVVDLRQELKTGNRSIFSRTLQSGLERTLANREQAILFLNRRGSATFVMCRDCGHVLTCPRCDVPLTYHANQAMLVCNRCNHRTRAPQRCPQCGSRRIKHFGVGTQRVEAVTRELYPEARIARWDSDAVTDAQAHAELLAKLQRHEVDIVVGTQMLAKGLDLPLVTLVGVISADTALNLPDFRAAERTYQLLEQVAGRAGRSILGGKVIVQTYAPEHYAVMAASEHDYAAFYAREMAFRRSLGYPPLSRLAKIVYTANNEAQASEATMGVADELRAVARRSISTPIQIMGPMPCFHSPLKDKHRWQILLLGSTIQPLLIHVPSKPGWLVDVDPTSIL